MTFLNVSLAYLAKMVQPQSTSLSFVLTAKYEFENKSSQYQYNTLPQHVFQLVHNVRFLAPLAVGQRAYVMVRFPSCVRPSVR